MENNKAVALRGDIARLFQEHCLKANEACKEVPVGEVEPGRRVFVPKPTSAVTFSDALVDNLLDVLVGRDTDVHVAPRFGGRVLTFPSPEKAKEVKAKFPVSVTHFGKVHVFEVAETPEELNDFKCKVMRLPVGTTVEDVTRWAKAMALQDSHVKKVHLYSTRSGRATDAALVIWQVAPPRVCQFNLHNFGATEGVSVLTAPMNREVTCSHCQVKCHTKPQCPYLFLEKMVAASSPAGGGRCQFRNPRRQRC